MTRKPEDDPENWKKLAMMFTGDAGLDGGMEEEAANRLRILNATCAQNLALLLAAERLEDSDDQVSWALAEILRMVERRMVVTFDPPAAKPPKGRAN